MDIVQVIQFVMDIVQVIQFIKDIVQVIQFVMDIVQVIQKITNLVVQSMDREVPLLQILIYPFSVGHVGHFCPCAARYCTQSSASR